MKKKILHLNIDLDITSGITRYIHLLAKNLSDDFEHHVISFSSCEDKKYDFEDSIIVYELSSAFFPRKLIMPFYVWRYISKHQIDIIHSHHRYFDLTAAIISKFSRVKTIMTVHSKVDGKKMLSYHASTIVTVSKSISDHLENYFGVNRERIKIINNFIDFDTIKLSISREDARASLGVQQNEILIGYIGRLDFREKGIDILLEAFDLLKKDFHDIRLILVGNGRNVKQVKKMNEKRNLQILIKEPEPRVFDLFQALDLFALPSKVDPFPYVMMEAAALKIPIVASKVDGIPEFIDHNVNGLLFEKNNIGDLISKIESMITNESLRNELSERLYKKVIDKYGKEKILPYYSNLYNG